MSETNAEILSEIRRDLAQNLGIGNYAIRRLLSMYTEAQATVDRLRSEHRPARADDGRITFDEGYNLGWIDGLDKINPGVQAAWDFSGTKQLAAERVAREAAAAGKDT